MQLVKELPIGSLAVTKYSPNPIRFSSVKRRKVEAEFSGGAITGNGGIPLLAEVDRQLGLTCSMSRHLDGCDLSEGSGHRLGDPPGGSSGDRGG